MQLAANLNGEAGFDDDPNQGKVECYPNRELDQVIDTPSHAEPDPLSQTPHRHNTCRGSLE